MPSPPARAVVSRLDTGNHPRDTLFRHCLCSLQSTKYGYIRYGQSSKGCALPALLMQSSVYRVRLYQIRAIIQGMRSSGIACTVFRLPSTVTIIRGMVFSTARAVIGLSDTDNMRSSGSACAIFSLPSTVISDTGNHPRDTLFRHHLCSRQSIEYGYNHPRNPLFHCLCSGQPIRYGQSSKRCALPAPFVQSSVYRVRLQQSSEGCLSLLLVQLSVY